MHRHRCARTILCRIQQAYARRRLTSCVLPRTYTPVLSAFKGQLHGLFSLSAHNNLRSHFLWNSYGLNNHLPLVMRVEASAVSSRVETRLLAMLTTTLSSLRRTRRPPVVGVQAAQLLARGPSVLGRAVRGQLVTSASQQCGPTTSIPTQEEMIKKYIAKLDTRGLIEFLPDGSINYSSQITLHRAITKPSSTKLVPEEYRRAMLVAHLVYERGYDESNIELEVPMISDDSGDNKRLDLVLLRPDGQYYLYAEVKADLETASKVPKLFREKVFPFASKPVAGTNAEMHTPMVGVLFASRVSSDGCVKPNVAVVDMEKYPTEKAWTSQGSPWSGLSTSASSIPSGYESPVVGKPYGNVVAESEELKPLLPDKTGAELDLIRTRIHDLLWSGGAAADTDVYRVMIEVRPCISMTSTCHSMAHAALVCTSPHTQCTCIRMVYAQHNACHRSLLWFASCLAAAQLILCRVHDELNTKASAPYAFQVLADGHEPPDALIKRMRDLYRDAAQEPNAAVEQPFSKCSPQAIRDALKELEPISLTHNLARETDVLGDFYEKTLSTTFKQSRGQFFTHRCVADFVVQFSGVADKVQQSFVRDHAAPPELPKVIDPTAGSGTFLVEAMKQMDESLNALKMNDGATLNQKQREWLSRYAGRKSGTHGHGQTREWATNLFYGIESNQSLWLASKLNMQMRGVSADGIFEGDALRPFDEFRDNGNSGKASNLLSACKEAPQFDYVFSNPPFSLTLPDSVRQNLKDRKFELSQKASEVIFLEQWTAMLRERGTFSVVIPEAFLELPKHLSARMYLLQRFWLRAVVALPEDAFMPFTGTRTAVLVAEKKTAAEVETWAAAIEEARDRKLKGAACVEFAFKTVASAQEEERQLFLAEPQHIGYKRQKGRPDLLAPNDLTRVLARWNVGSRESRESDRRCGSWVPLSSITNRKSLRFDPKYLWRWSICDGRVFTEWQGEVQPLRALIQKLKAQKVPKGPLNVDGAGDANSIATSMDVGSDDYADQQGACTPSSRTKMSIDPDLPGSFVLETKVEELTGAQIEFGDSQLALFAMPPFHVVRNQPDKQWLGR